MTKAPSRLVLVWLLLVGLTLTALVSGSATSSPKLAATAVIIAAMIKVRFVVMEFMEVGNSPWPLRLVADGWVIVLSAVLLLLLG